MSEVDNKIEQKYDMANEFNRKTIINEIGNDIKENTILGALSFEKGFKINIDKDHKEIKALNDYFKSGMDSDTDKNIKKVVATATIIAKEKKMLRGKFWDNKTPSDITNIVDNAMTKAKLAYKVGTGEFEPIDAFEYMVDRTVSKVSTIIHQKAVSVASTAGATIGAAIGNVLGPVGSAAGAVIGTVVGGLAGKTVGGYIAKGVKAVGKVVKAVAKTVYEGAKKIAKGIFHFLFG